MRVMRAVKDLRKDCVIALHALCSYCNTLIMLWVQRMMVTGMRLVEDDIV